MAPRSPASLALLDWTLMTILDFIGILNAEGEGEDLHLSFSLHFLDFELKQINLEGQLTGIGPQRGSLAMQFAGRGHPQPAQDLRTSP